MSDLITPSEVLNSFSIIAYGDEEVVAAELSRLTSRFVEDKQNAYIAVTTGLFAVVILLYKVYNMSMLVDESIDLVPRFPENVTEEAREAIIHDSIEFARLLEHFLSERCLHPLLDMNDLELLEALRTAMTYGVGLTTLKDKTLLDQSVDDLIELWDKYE